MATAHNGSLTLTRREERILRRAQRALVKLDSLELPRTTSATQVPNTMHPEARLRPVPGAAVQRPSKAPAWLQRLIVRRATRTRPQERAAFAVGLAVGIVLTAALIGAVLGGEAR
jgi:hypothetical protein